MKETELKRLIEEHESANVEFKSSLAAMNEIVEELAALATTGDNLLLVGVSDSLEILGVNIGKDTIERLTNKIITNTEPHIYPEISVKEVNSKNIITIKVQESVDKPVLAFGRPYKRVGKSSMKMGKDEYEKIILEKHKNKIRFDGQLSNKATPDDIDEEKVKWFLREAIVNAVCHRDYTPTGDITLGIFDDRVEIANPGDLPKPLTPAKLKKMHKSIPRNQLIANAFFLVRNIEQWGEGTNKIVKWCTEHGLDEPEFQNNSGGFEITLTGPGKEFEEEIEKEKLHILEINERQKKAVEYIKEHGSISNREYRNLCKVSHKTAHEELTSMTNKGILKQKGKGRAVHYKIR